MLVASGVMKLVGSDAVSEEMGRLGLPLSMVTPLGILELACVAVYALPATSVLGAILLTGYLGGAICTHWRVGDPVYLVIALGILVWLGLYLREGRLGALLPVRGR
jgi:hypothetical protein